MNCKKCKNCNLKKEICEADMWDRNSEDEPWLKSDEDFKYNISKSRICSEFEPV